MRNLRRITASTVETPLLLDRGLWFVEIALARHFGEGNRRFRDTPMPFSFFSLSQYRFFLSFGY